MRFNFFKNMKTTFIISSLLIIFSLYSINKSGLNYGIEFMGGTELVVSFQDDVKVEDIRADFIKANYNTLTIQNYGDSSNNEFLLRLPIEETTEVINVQKYKRNLRNVLDAEFSPEGYSIKRIDFIGPKVGKELVRNGIYSIIFGSMAILIYVFFRFSFSFGIASICALFHDFILTAFLINILNIEITLSSIAAILTVIGYSVNDTIVIFDRVRENIKNLSESLEDVIQISIVQTLSRTILTVITVLIVLIPLYLVGGVEIKDLALIMILGVGIGTYSSIFYAPYLMYLFNKRNKND
ncbi:MAG: protein translocase subunit SecF [Thermodesulfobacteriota bacteirum]|jgi:preprotein translocase subunit SecF|nr:protein translocase subunit SecF [Thermodesulfobacteriota bacterium]